MPRSTCCGIIVPRTSSSSTVDCIPVGLAEARLLCGLASLQRGNARTARTALTDVLSRAGVHALLRPMARIAAILDIEGHRLPLWRDLPIPMPRMRLVTAAGTGSC